MKLDFLVTEIQDIITQCLNLLQKNKKIEQNLTLRQMYNKYLAPTVLPLEDERLWNAASSGKILKLFQFDANRDGKL